ncbi:MAG: MMPL family transporter [Planctomycetes bacterium]|nr:MMPL family transporter [Planctomycetota bacterium]
MPKTQGIYAKFHWLMISACVLAAPFLWAASMRVLATNSNDISQWLPNTLDEKRHFEAFLARFPAPDTIIVSWPGCTLKDPRLGSFSAAMAVAQSDETAGRLLAYAVTGAELADQLMGNPLALARERAIDHLLGTVIGSDRETSCALVALSDEGAAKPAAALEIVYRAAAQCGIGEDDLRLAGPAVEHDVMNRETDHLLLRFSIASAVVSLLVAWWCLKRLPMVGMLFVTALAITGVGMTVYDLAGGKMNSMLMLMPALLFVYAISGGVHVINYFQDAVNEGGVSGAAERGVSAGWQPCFLSSLTTAIGLGSLMVSEIEPVRMFGIYSAIGLVLGFCILFLLLPSLLHAWAVAFGWQKSDTQPRAQEASALWDRAWMFQRRHHGKVTALVCLFMLVSGAGFYYIMPSAKLKDTFWTSSKIYQDYLWIEEKLGPLTTIELVVTFQRDCPMDHEARMALIARLQREVSELEPQSTSTSAATLTPRLPNSRGVVSAARRLRLLKFLNRAGFYVRDEDAAAEIWRITVRIPATGDTGFDDFCNAVHARLDQIEEETGTAGVSILQTGTVPLLSKIQQELWQVLLQSFFWSFVLIAGVMVIALRSVPGGLVAMIPNLLPLCVSFGLMGWFGMALDIGAIMTASIALGIAVDDTFHFLCWFDRMRRDGCSRSDAVRWVYQRCGAAMMQSSLICSCGLLVFFFSGFVPAAQFGIMIFIMLMVALLGDLVLLPALLLGFAGRWFGRVKSVVPAPHTKKVFDQSPQSVPVEAS